MEERAESKGVGQGAEGKRNWVLNLESLLKPRLSGLGLRPSGFDPTRRVQRSGLKNSQPAFIKGILSSSFFIKPFHPMSDVGYSES